MDRQAFRHPGLMVLMMAAPDAEERGLVLWVAFPFPSCVTSDEPLTLSELIHE